MWKALRYGHLYTGWQRLIGSPKLQIIFHKRATKYRSLLRKMTYKDKGSYESSPPCNRPCATIVKDHASCKASLESRWLWLKFSCNRDSSFSYTWHSYLCERPCDIVTHIFHKDERGHFTFEKFLKCEMAISLNRNCLPQRFHTVDTDISHRWKALRHIWLSERACEREGEKRKGGDGKEAGGGIGNA